MKLTAQIGDREREVAVEPVDDAEGRFRVTIDGVERLVDARRIGSGAWSLLVADQAWTVDIDPGRNGELLVEVHGQVFPVKLIDPKRKLLERAHVQRPAAAGPMTIVAPMPGKVVKMLVKPGDAVASGQALVVVEAMKMENELRAPRAATISAVHVKEGQAVEGAEGLVTLA